MRPWFNLSIVHKMQHMAAMVEMGRLAQVTGAFVVFLLLVSSHLIPFFHLDAIVSMTACPPNGAVGVLCQRGRCSPYVGHKPAAEGVIAILEWAQTILNVPGTKPKEMLHSLHLYCHRAWISLVSLGVPDSHCARSSGACSELRALVCGIWTCHRVVQVVIFTVSQHQVSGWPEPCAARP